MYSTVLRNNVTETCHGHCVEETRQKYITLEEYVEEVFTIDMDVFSDN